MVQCRIWPSMWICHFKRFWILRSASMIGQCRTSTIKIQPPKSIRNGHSWESNRHLQSIEKTLYRLSFCRCSCSQRPFHCPQSPQHLGHPWLFWLREESFCSLHEVQQPATVRGFPRSLYRSSKSADTINEKMLDPFKVVTSMAENEWNIPWNKKQRSGKTTNGRLVDKI